MVYIRVFNLKLVTFLLITNHLPLHCAATNNDKSPLPLPFSLSLFYLSRLAEKEVDLYSHLKNGNFSKDKDASILRGYLSDYEQSSGIRGHWNVEQHPFLVYRMLWRFVNYIPKLLPHLNSLDQDGGIVYPPPTIKTIVAIIDAIIVIQNHFKLPVSELMRGKIGDFETGIGLTVRQAAEFAKIAIYLEYFVEAWEWIDHLSTLQSADEMAIRKLRESLISRHDLHHNNKSSHDDAHIFNSPLADGISPWRKDVEMESWLSIGKDSGVLKEYYYQTYAICRNLSRPSPPPLRQLKCWLDSKRNPYFVLAPLKTELLSSSPKMYYIHNIVGDKLLKTFWDAATPGMLRDAGLPREQAKIRSMNLASLYETVPEYSTFSAKLELITGLNILDKDFNSLRVSQYQYLGDAGVHHDAYKISFGAESKKKSFGDRLATIIIYMSDVAVGGETVFPLLNLAVKPVKGSLIFWYNYQSDGRIDWNMWHGVCHPVLGQKRIATTFIGVEDNMFKFSCIPDCKQSTSIACQ